MHTLIGFVVCVSLLPPSSLLPHVGTSIFLTIFSPRNFYDGNPFMILTGRSGTNVVCIKKALELLSTELGDEYVKINTQISLVAVFTNCSVMDELNTDFSRQQTSLWSRL
jgi:hypothetical protein